MKATDKMRIVDAIQILRPLKIVIRSMTGGEFRVNFRGGREQTAYYTNDLADAVNTGQAMATERTD